MIYFMQWMVFVTYINNYADSSKYWSSHWFSDGQTWKQRNGRYTLVRHNGMKSKKSKFQAMILNKHPDKNNISLNVNGVNIPLKPCVKLLRDFIDYELTFRST